ncbi:MAG: peptide ABC transporter substrate-binding protein [Lachnospiraceae bacterium]|nr:peptide ABC transporter substrate-binding protein [Lachnospiraceae bacterium]
MKKRLLAMLLSVSMVVSLTACGDSAQSGNAPEELAEDIAAAEEEAQNDAAATEADADAQTDADQADDAEASDALNVCIASEPDTLDPALNSAVDGATMLVHLFSGLAKWEKEGEGFKIVPDAAEELPEGVVNDDGTVTYTYKIRDGFNWSDGQPVTAKDFEFAWQRAASVALAADYGYMFEVVDGYNDVWDVDDDGNPKNPDAKLNVKAVDDKTLEVTLYNKVSYWNELLAFPVYFPVREDVVSNESWATDPSTYVCNGPYTMTDWQHNSVITLKKNDAYADADQITMPEIRFYLSDDANNMLTNFKNGDWAMIDDVPVNEIAALKTDYPNNFFVEGQIGTYYVCWNINQELLPEGSGLSGAEAEKARAEIRNALSLLIDRNYIVDSIAQGGQVPASSFVAMGLTDADGSEFYKNAGTNSFDGYYDTSAEALESNFNNAVETLKKYYEFDESSQTFKNVPTLTYLYNTSDAHKAIGEYLQSAFAAVGVTMNLENQEWATFLNTRKEGNYSVARNGWLADYNDPICFLDMWTTASGNNDVQYGKGAHEKVAAYNLDLTDVGMDVKVENGTWAETYDVLIDTIKSCDDQKTRYAMMHKAEDMLMETGCICPLYFYTDMFMIDDKLQGFFSNPLGYKYFMYSHF